MLPLAVVTAQPFKLPFAIALAALPWLNPFSPGPSPAVVPWLVSFACGIALWLLALRGAGPPPTRWLGGAALLLLLAWLPHPDTSEQLAIVAGGLLLAILAATAVRETTVARALAGGIVLAASISALAGLCQYLGVSPWLAPWVNVAEAGVAFGNLRQPNQFASLCWMGMAVLLWGHDRLPAFARLGLAALFGVATAASVSRTGMVQGAVLTLLVLAWRGPGRRERLVLCGVSGVAYFAASFLLPLVLQHMGLEPPRTLAARLLTDQACSSRLVLWANVLHDIAQKPVFGWGWGELDYAHFMTLYPGARFCDILDNAHNLPLHVAAELGLPLALAATLGFLVWVLRRAPWREVDDQRRLAWALLALVLLHSMLEYPLWYGPFQIVAGAALGWLQLPRAAAVTARPGPWRAVAAVLLCATAYAGWDYARVSQMYVVPERRLAPWRENTMEQAQRSWLFARQAWFAALTVAESTRENAADIHALALEVLHYSPEPRVIERVIESATLLGRDDEAVLYLARYRAAFPKDYEAWRAGLRGQRAP